MKIAFLGLRGFAGMYGGIERHVENLALNLSKHGHDITVYCMKGYSYDNRNWYGIKIVNLPHLRLKSIEMLSYGLLCMLHILIYGNYEILHCQSVELSFLLLAARLFKHKCKIYVTSHGPAYRRTEKWNKFLRILMHIAEYGFAIVPHKRIVIAEFLKTFYTSRYRKAFYYIPNGVTINWPTSDNFLRHKKLKKHNYVLYVGRLVPSKGCHYLIQAFKFVDPPYKLVIVGEGVYTDEYVKSLQAMANEKIIFLGKVVGDPLWHLYSNALLFVFPSEVESLPMVMLEAFGFGLPVVYCDVPENRAIAHTIAIPFKKGDMNDLAKQMRWAIDNIEQARELGLKAREMIQIKYDWKVITNQFEKLYKMQ